MKKISVALGGGGSKCFAHLGILAELEREHIAIDSIAGTSMGAFIAALYCNNVDIDAIRREFLRFSNIIKWYLPNGFFTFS